MKRLAIICSLLMCFGVNANAADKTPSNDNRVVLEVTVEERDFILERMRRMLETLTSVQQTIILDSPENADNLVRNLVAYTTEEYPEGWYERMPEGFKQMEDRLNERWRTLAENNTSDSKQILKNTVQVMATCNACHRSYKIGLE
ncbi:MAG: cytochrome c [Pseudomonadota bacterium]